MPPDMGFWLRGGLFGGQLAVRGSDPIIPTVYRRCYNLADVPLPVVAISSDRLWGTDRRRRMAEEMTFAGAAVASNCDRYPGDWHRLPLAAPARTVEPVSRSPWPCRQASPPRRTTGHNSGRRVRRIPPLPGTRGSTRSSKKTARQPPYGSTASEPWPWPWASPPSPSGGRSGPASCQRRGSKPLRSRERPAMVGDDYGPGSSSRRSCESARRPPWSDARSPALFRSASSRRGSPRSGRRKAGKEQASSLMVRGTVSPHTCVGASSCLRGHVRLREVPSRPPSKDPNWHRLAPGTRAGFDHFGRVPLFGGRPGGFRTRRGSATSSALRRSRSCNLAI